MKQLDLFEQEIWCWYDKHECFISNLGKVKNNLGIYKNITCTCYGYPTTSVRNNGKPCGMSVHLMVGRIFVPNPDNKPELNHIDCDKTNSRWDNLEWVTRSENTLHQMLFYAKGTHYQSKVTGKIYGTIKDARKECNYKDLKKI